MATNLPSLYTLVEQAKQISPEGKQMRIAEVMAKEISMVVDIPFYPSNDIWSHKSLRAASIPAGTWRGVNEYVASEVALDDEVLDVIGICETFATYDIEYIDNMPDPMAARLRKAKRYIEGLAQTLCSAFLYSNNQATPKKPHGIAPRLNATGRYVISNGGSSALTSIYVINWDEDTVYGVYPKNSEAPNGDPYPVMHKDLGERVDVNSSGNKLRVYEDNFKMKAGLVIEDNRAIGRVCNVPSATAATQTWENDLIVLMDRMKTGPGTRIYMNEAMISAARIRMKDKNNVHWTPDGGKGLFGESVMKFDETPVRKIDSAILLNSESSVT
ncbi:hypothetical protein LCGC14_0359610 [marine sediment metagenome]|uniref:Bacteriophage Mu GpT domain-containing protein n=1 Tax=marine sediment metagenome TaxID=412755 RepID=A0A0F9VVS1_9ZZZZ|nr:hypothetical protein [Candidatus Aminicenantes bacterium]